LIYGQRGGSTDGATSRQYIEAANRVRIRARDHPILPAGIVVPGETSRLLEDIIGHVVDVRADGSLDEEATIWLHEHFLEVPQQGEPTADDVICWLEEAARIFGLLDI
jgi:hypothetical protein